VRKQICCAIVIIQRKQNVDGEDECTRQSEYSVGVATGLKYRYLTA